MRSFHETTPAVATGPFQTDSDQPARAQIQEFKTDPAVVITVLNEFRAAAVERRAIVVRGVGFWLSGPSYGCRGAPSESESNARPISCDLVICSTIPG